MIVITQIVVIIVALVVLVYGLTGRKTHMARAWKKISICLLALAMAVAVIFPNSTNEIAHWVGVGRGADLLLYLVTLAFIIYALNSYLNQQSERDAVIRLARKVALLDASARYDKPSKQR